MMYYYINEQDNILTFKFKEENKMFNFDVPRYEKVVGDAIALRPQIEKAVDEICKELPV